MTEEQFFAAEGGVKPLNRYHLLVPRDNAEEIEKILKDNGFRFKKQNSDNPILTFYVNRKNANESFLNTVQDSLLPLT